MSEQLDVYRDWLKITATNRPLTYYQLLHLKQFEDDVTKIRAHYQKLVAHVRKYLQTEHADKARELLNELARAMLCLTDAQRKQEYDRALGRTDVTITARRSFEQILLANKILDQQQLEKARRFAETVGLELRDAILQQRLAPPEQVMIAYAESQGLPYLALEEVEIDEQLVPMVPPKIARQYSVVPVMIEGETLVVASPNPLVPDVEEELRLRFDMPVRAVICTPAAVNALINKYYSRDFTPVTPAKGKLQKAAAEAAPQRAPAPSAPTSAKEITRRHIMYAIIGFNMTVIVAMLLQNILSRHPNFVISAAVALVLGAVVAGVVYYLSEIMGW